MEKDTVVVYHPAAARHLLKLGYKLVDIKPDREDDSKQRSVFIFERTDELI